MSLDKQSESDFEVIIAEDDNDQHTPIFIETLQKKHSFPITLLSQKVDDGFRKNQILNKAIAAVKSKKICFIDGDCVLHRHFIRTYDRMIKKGLICF